jgi:pimeloyl-ACP methyl ester carboxylesterase
VPTKLTRRTVLGMLPAVLAAQPKSAPRPFKIQVPKSDVDRILRRVRETKFPPRLDATDGRYGADWNYMRALVDYWSKDYDWRKAEARLNRYPQFIAKVADSDIHFYHVRSPKPNALPIILTHGWPGSVVEFQDVIQPLSQDFDLVIPSLPGFGFSSKPKGRPVGALTTARLWHELMTQVLGYQRYGVQGGDWGSTVSTNLARLHPESVVGLHLNSAQAAAGPEEAAWTTASTAYRATELDYFNIQQRKTQTVSFALSDNPVGTAAWMVEKFKTWSDSGETLDALTKDQVLTNIMFYLVSNSESTGVWFYRGAAEDGPAPTGRVTVPTGVAAFPKEMTVLAPPRSALERAFNLVHYTTMPRGGHFAAWEQPVLFAEDVRKFFSSLR